MPKRVLIGMSGGVDSSVAALMLLESGYRADGATLRLFTDEDIGMNDRGRTCCSLEDVENARTVCYRLGIRHYVFNFSDDFRKKVIESFAESYERGETPNPCIECNRYIKFPKMLERARLLEYDYIATGHYVRREESSSGRVLIKKAVDSTKDQTYVLYVLTQDILKRTLFPLGGMTKEQSRELAEKNGLINARKPDSQDICFIKDGDYAGFLENTMGVKSPKGSFVYKDGTVLGEHKGIIHYTIGQRKGLGISYAHPVFVLDKNPCDNIVTLGENQDLFTSRLKADRLNWIALERPIDGMRVKAKTRYSQKESCATIHILSEDEVEVEFDEKQRAITKGQSVVFYEDEYVVGGGTIR